MGVLWALITPTVWVVVRDDGVFPEPSAQGRWFSADGWFLVLGMALGVLLAVVAVWSGRRHPVGALIGLTIGGLVGAATAWWLGGLLGPDDPAAMLASATAGTRVEQSLGLRAMAVLLAPAIAGVATFVAVAAAVPAQVASDRLGE